ncbi:hypothetical protein Tco_1553262, partial [Tanacetum coccineum]
RRHNKSNIKGLTINRVWREDPALIKAAMARHYKELFKERSAVRPIFYCQKIEKISRDEVTVLEREFSEMEVWDAVRGCGSDKALGRWI